MSEQVFVSIVQNIDTSEISHSIIPGQLRLAGLEDLGKVKANIAKYVE